MVLIGLDKYHPRSRCKEKIIVSLSTNKSKIFNTIGNNFQSNFTTTKSVIYIIFSSLYLRETIYVGR